MNLSTMNLVPLRTWCKARDGRRALFLSATATRYRFIIDGQVGTYLVHKNGRYSSRPISVQSDSYKYIIAVGRKWRPQVGDRIRVYGVACRESPTVSNNTYSGVEVYRISTLPDNRGFLKFQDGSRVMETHIRNIKREP